MKNSKKISYVCFILCAIIFSIWSCKKKAEPQPDPATKPTVTTTDVTVFTQVTATFGGNVTADGGGIITERGVCWSTSPNPTTANDFKVSGTGTGVFSVAVTGLSLGTKYYVKAYATNSAGTSYGDEKSFTTDATLALGLPYAGGLIFYLDGTNLHGMVCPATDQGTNLKWGCPTTKIAGALGTEVGKGAINTAAILSGCSDPGTSADVCSKLVLNGFSDWFLPSTDEMVLMYTNLKVKGLGNFGDFHYVTSTQSPVDDGFSATVRFGDGGTQYGGKNNPSYVRAARAF